MNGDNQVTPYEMIGGEAALLRLVERFYFYMDTLPEASEVRALHAEDLTLARKKLLQFLSGWLGGPDLYVREYGHPRLRMRHAPFAIGPEESEQWLLCMNRALSDLPIQDDFRQRLSLALQQLARHMINRSPQ